MRNMMSNNRPCGLTEAAHHPFKGIPRPPLAIRIGEEIASLAGETDPKKHLKQLKGASNPPRSTRSEAGTTGWFSRS